MSIINNNPAIEEFLSAMEGAKEVGLVIAKNNEELLNFVEAMDSAGFKRSEGTADLLKSPKTYFVADENLNKDVYDFIVQYSTGQVEIFEKKLMRLQTLFPDYKNSAVVLLVDKNNLNKIQEKGFDLLSATSPAFQS